MGERERGREGGREEGRERERERERERKSNILKTNLIFFSLWYVSWFLRKVFTNITPEFARFCKCEKRCNVTKKILSCIEKLARKQFALVFVRLSQDRWRIGSRVIVNKILFVCSYVGQTANQSDVRRTRRQKLFAPPLSIERILDGSFRWRE